jgi:hypothetical protein
MTAQSTFGPVRRSATAPRIAAALGAFIFLVAASAGCSVVNKINSIRHSVDSNRAAIKAFTDGLSNGKAVPFQATYVTTGNSPTTVTYAVQPPKNISFSETATGANTSASKLIANSSGEYACSQLSQGAQWSCNKLGKASAIAQNQLFAIYTPGHWVTFLHLFAIGAGLAGDKVTTSSKTVNGFSMNCVDLFAKGQGTTTICSTHQNILGYVKVAAQSTTFEIKSYTSAPPASAFRLPPGATLTHH